MAIGWITLLILIIAAFVVFKIVKSLIKTLFLMATIVGIVIFVFIFFVMSDAQKLQESSSILLLQDGDAIDAGVYLEFGVEAEPDFVSNAELDEFNVNFKEDDLDAIKGDNNKIFFFDRESFEDVSSVELGEMSFTKQEVFELIDSDNVINDFEEKAGGKIQITDDGELKGLLFALLVDSAVKENPSFLIEDYSQVYPRTILFKIPKFIAKKIVKVEGEEDGNNG